MPTGPSSAFLLFKFPRGQRQQLPDGQLLGAGLFAGAAAHAGRGLAAGHGGVSGGGVCLAPQAAAKRSGMRMAAGQPEVQ